VAKDAFTIRGYYQILGISPGAQLDQISQAHRDQILVWHPDRFTGQLSRLRAMANDRMKMINVAHDYLKLHWEERGDLADDNASITDLRQSLKDAEKRNALLDNKLRKTREQFDSDLLNVSKRAQQNREEAESLRLELQECERWKAYWEGKVAVLARDGRRWYRLVLHSLGALSAGAVIAEIVGLLVFLFGIGILFTGTFAVREVSRSSLFATSLAVSRSIGSHLRGLVAPFSSLRACRFWLAQRIVGCDICFAEPGHGKEESHGVAR
jgi:hypothetical protein